MSKECSKLSRSVVKRVSGQQQIVKLEFDVHRSRRLEGTDESIFPLENAEFPPKVAEFSIKVTVLVDFIPRRGLGVDVADTPIVVAS